MAKLPERDREAARPVMHGESITSKHLVPAKAATFQGSFAADQRQQDRVIVPAEPGIRGHTWAYFTTGWGVAEIWKSAFIEGVASMSLCYLSALIDITLANFKTSEVAAFVGVSNIFLLSLFIFSTAPASGGHINPLITFTTVTTGLTGLPRGVLYMIGQTIGGAVAGGIIRGIFGPILTRVYNGGGCVLNTNEISVGQALLLEIVSTFILLFISFGVGLDPRQAQLFGPVLGPFLVACTLGLVSFASAGVAQGYTGAGMNPARCFAFAVARGEFHNQWIWWVGPLAGALLQTVVYRAVPPYHTEK